jgi:hypothetical protein
MLPAGAVVDSAKIIVNGKEKTATVYGRMLARQIYARAVHSKQDPLLVSTCGLDQVLVQCYPIEPGSDVKVKLSIAAPVIPDPKDKFGTIALPAFAERNFIADQPTQVEISSDKPVCAAANNGLTRSNNPTQLSGKVDATALSRFATVLKIEDAIGVAQNNDKVPAVLICNGYGAPKQVTVVIDGSASMSPYLHGIADGLKQIQPQLLSAIYTVDDTTKELSTFHKMSVPEVEHMECIGGQDDSIVLSPLLRNQGVGQNRAILWIHAAQPVASRAHDILQSLPLSGASELYDLQVSAGANAALDGELETQKLIKVPNTGNVEDSLKWLAGYWSIDGKLNVPNMNTSKDADNLLLRVGTSQKVRSEIWKDGQNSVELQHTMDLASNLKLITPLTSAVVVDPELLPETRYSAGNHESAPSPASDLKSIVEPMFQFIVSNLQPVMVQQNMARNQLAQLSARPEESDKLYTDDPGTLNNNAPKSAPVNRTWTNDSSAGDGWTAAGKLSSGATATDASSGGDGWTSAGKLSSGATATDEGEMQKSLQLERAPSNKKFFNALPMLEAKPTPEPDTYALIAVVILMMGGGLIVSRRRRVREVSGR